mmetsp:Transcript_21826/g.32490  ORF Transcript_21826/g.32490 Transcript_21826/m.32490 type:complete len:123 (-) Transcript_21826:139-507(-)
MLATRATSRVMVATAIRQRTTQPALFVMGGTRLKSSLGETMNKKEKVEEDRYMRRMEEMQLEKIRAQLMEAKAAQDKAMQDEIHNTYIAPVMADVEKVLDGSGDTVSEEGLKKLAKWHLGFA